MPEISLVEFADRLNRVLPAVISAFARRQKNELYKGKITLPQFIILDFLSRDTETKMTQLAGMMDVTTAAMTGVIQRLVRENYVSRNFDSSDRRIIRIKITAKGAKLVTKINRQRREMVIDIFGRISEAERRDYLKILEHIHRILLESKT